MQKARGFSVRTLWSFWKDFIRETKCFTGTDKVYRSCSFGYTIFNLLIKLKSWTYELDFLKQQDRLEQERYDFFSLASDLSPFSREGVHLLPVVIPIAHVVCKCLKSLT